MAQGSLIAKGISRPYTCMLCPEEKVILIANHTTHVFQLTCCGQRICSDCKKDIIHTSTSIVCKSCQATYHYETFDKVIKRDRNVTKELQKYPVRCHNEGCATIIEAQDLDDHAKECRYRLVACSLGCKEKVQEINIGSGEHEKSCQFSKRAEEEIPQQNQQELLGKIESYYEHLKSTIDNLQMIKENLQSKNQLHKDFIAEEKKKQDDLEQGMAILDNQHKEQIRIHKELKKVKPEGDQ